MKNLIEQLIIENPKQNSRKCIGHNNFYSYYAGFSPSFVNSLLTSSNLSKEANIVDPWNGSGTTTTAAIRLGHYTQGYDLNPVMVIAAKACMLNAGVKNSLWPIAADIMSKASEESLLSANDDDPLCTWMVPNSVMVVRSIEKALQNLLVDNENYQLLITRNNFNDLSDIAAFFYAALFRCTRSLVSDFITSNPTWIKKPKLLSSRLQPSKKMIVDKFGMEVLQMIRSIDQDVCDSQSIVEEARIEVASSILRTVLVKSAEKLSTV